MRRLKVLVSAYACEPGRGSEPGVGWNVAREAARRHDIWVLTRANNRPAIEAELARNPVPSMRFLYYDLPRWAGWWKRGQRGVHLYYYLWQLGAYGVAKELNRRVGLDLTHHATFVNYWKPSSLALLPVPFVWGPVGGGESAPGAFWSGFGFYGRAYEGARGLARWLGERDPLVRAGVRRSAVAVATTEETAVRLRELGADDVRMLTQVGIDDKELDRLGRLAVQHEAGGEVRFISVGRALHWKGFHLGVRAFARAALPGTRYWVVGDGPELRRLEKLAHGLGVGHLVKFWGRLPRDETLRRIGECHALVHPSLHESGGWVCTEAMALGRPVVCLNLGGPAIQVSEETGFKVPAIGPEQAVDGLADAMRALAEDRGLRVRMGVAGRRRAAEHLNWREKGRCIDRFYEEALSR